jgi:hypothetical protein
MCTLSYFPINTEETVLTFNRDEQPNRSSVEVVTDAQKKILYPKDRLHGGTWIGIQTTKKRISCLLNGGFTRHERTPPYKKSRGLMLLESLEYNTIQDFFDRYNFQNIEPFTLITHTPNALCVGRWDGVALDFSELDARKPQIWSSATLYDAPVQVTRAAWFSEAFSEPNPTIISAENIWKFHQTGGQHDPENALCMQRPTGVETVSITQISLSTLNLKFKYYERRNHALYNWQLQFATNKACQQSEFQD